ncbi:hypothetical protein [Fodinicola feengrottensis]|uniref:WXG100 family type VII secretion target n=1 Tax=Fodinicola feengrottensis TaxID=435914 RepID=A0ABP4USE9_9ACTN|nr:hypothetical protein [Fodinicola feengrottensis]
MTAPGANIDVESAAAMMSSLRAAADQINTQWASAKGQIGSWEGQLGRDDLGQLFMAKYRPAATAVEQQAQQQVDAGERLATVGAQSVQLYQAADAQAKQGFPGAPTH